MKPRAAVDELLNRHATVGFAIGVVRDGRLEFFRAHGLADIGSATPVTADTVFRIASITKTFTAIALMQLWEQGLVDLDAQADKYLRAFKLVPARPGLGVPTLRQLLTHTSGIPEELHLTDGLKPLFGETVRAGHPVPPLAEYYKRGLPVRAKPGSRFVYTDHNYTAAAQIVEDVSGVPFATYLREEVFDRLGMTHTDLVRSERVKSQLATGYKLGGHGAQQVRDYDVITTGGGGAFSSPNDMALYLAALMNGGANDHSAVLKPSTLELMFAPQYRPDPRLSGLGLAFWRQDVSGHQVVEHGGILPGFDSQVFIAPAERVGVMAFTNGARNAMLWLPVEVGSLLAKELGVTEAAIRDDVPQHPELWERLCGRYRLAAGLTDLRLHMMAGLGANVFVRRGELVGRMLMPVPAALRGFVLHPDDPDDPYAFRIDLTRFGLGKPRVFFAPDGRAGKIAVYPEFVPLQLEKV